MAEIIQEEHGDKKGKRRAKKHSTHIDMTPMVDLMCLLITFFMLTSAFSKPKIMEIILPDKNKPKDQKAPQAAASRTLNIILGEDNKIYWYPGKADKPPFPPLQITDFSATGIRKILVERNRTLFKKIDEFNNDILTGKQVMPRDSVAAAIRKLKTTDDTGPIILIKADAKAKYKNLVDIIDEMAITSIARYAIVDINYIEQKMLDDTRGANATTTPTTSNAPKK
jgi:biopolymer transport protein ExbD